MALGLGPATVERRTMNGAEMLRLVDMMHREKNIPKDIIFDSIEAALQMAAERVHGVPEEDDVESDEPEVEVTLDRLTGTVTVKKGDQLIDPEGLGRIAAQSAK